MTASIITVKCGGPGLSIPYPPQAYPQLLGLVAFDNSDNRMSPCAAYQCGLKKVRAAKPEPDVLIYIHDDVTIYKTYDADWLDRVLDVFERQPDCAVVGLGGALGLGQPGLYKVPYRIENLARRCYLSNQADAEVHGARFDGVRRVAVVDAFFMAVRYNFLNSLGGWPVDRLTHHCLDLWLACEAARRSKETYIVGASCSHHGGGTSTKSEYAKASWLQGGSLAMDHRLPHRWLYEEYRDVLPIEVSDV